MFVIVPSRSFCSLEAMLSTVMIGPCPVIPLQTPFVIWASVSSTNHVTSTAYEYFSPSMYIPKLHFPGRIASK